MLLFITVSLTWKKCLVASRKAVCVSSSPSTVVLQYASSEHIASSRVSGPGVGGVTYLLTKHGPRVCAQLSRLLLATGTFP